MYKYHGSSQLGSKRSGSNHPCLKKRSEELREGRGEQLVSKIRLEGGGREWKRQPCPMRSADLTTHTIMAPLEKEKELGKAYARGAFFGNRVRHPWMLDKSAIYCRMEHKAVKFMKLFSQMCNGKFSFS